MSATELLFFQTPAEAAQWCAEQRSEGRTLGFVPTMGALHEGHLALVAAARADCERVCVSLFVNPLQFDDPSDLEGYPRDLDGDRERLTAAGCDMFFTGTLQGFFPGRLTEDGRLPAEQRVDPGPSAVGLEGEARPGHFSGVATICRRLFELVEPERAYFGRKDYQQCLVVRDLARARGGPEVIVCPTVRAPSGLALSSRNARLSAGDRERAAALFAALVSTREQWIAGERRAPVLARGLQSELQRAGFAIEYAAVRDSTAWSAEEPAGELVHAVALAAVRLGGVRLIDNLVLSDQEAEDRR